MELIFSKGCEEESVACASPCFWRFTGRLWCPWPLRHNHGLGLHLHMHYPPCSCLPLYPNSPFLWGHQSYWIWTPLLWPHLSLIIRNDPVSKYGPIHRSCGLGLQHHFGRHNSTHKKVKASVLIFQHKKLPQVSRTLVHSVLFCLDTFSSSRNSFNWVLHTEQNFVMIFWQDRVAQSIGQFRNSPTFSGTSCVGCCKKLP